MTLFGAAALARASQSDAMIARSRYYFATASTTSTQRRGTATRSCIGPWMACHRKDFFLATKTGSRTAAEAREDIHQLLERLRVDQIDLISGMRSGIRMTGIRRWAQAERWRQSCGQRKKGWCDSSA